jgi:hypothetical protein
MGLFIKYDDSGLKADLAALTQTQTTAVDQLNINTQSIADLNLLTEQQEAALIDLQLDDINQNAINRTYLRREKSGSTTIPLGNAPVDIQFDYQVQGKLNGQISTSDAITFTFNGNGVYLINTVVSFTDLVMPENGMGYCIVNMIIEGQKLRRLCGDHPNGNIGNISLQGSTVLIVAAGTKFKLQATAVDQGKVLGMVGDARTFLEIFEL